jgi:hypothetical protein
MSKSDPNEINRLIGEFTDLQERWENDAKTFEWSLLQALAQRGAVAYNEGAGPSFHALALDGVQHGEFHERFLTYSLQAGFDPFKLARAGSGTAEIPVIDHASLAEAARSNPSSARMKASLMELARTRFEPLVQQTEQGTPIFSDTLLWRTVEACAESIPVDLLARIAPELAAPHPGTPGKGAVDPMEGLLSEAEVIVDSSSPVHG